MSGFVKHLYSIATLSVQNFGKNFTSYTKQKSNGEHFMGRSTNFHESNIYLSALMFRIYYQSGPLFGVALGDRSYNILHFLNPPVDSDVYRS